MKNVACEDEENWRYQNLPEPGWEYQFSLAYTHTQNSPKRLIKIDKLGLLSAAWQICWRNLYIGPSPIPCSGDLPIFLDKDVPIWAAQMFHGWFGEHQDEMLPLSPRSLDFNINDHLWEVLEHRLRIRYQPPSSRNKKQKHSRQDWSRSGGVY